jgi:predicted esterase
LSETIEKTLTREIKLYYDLYLPESTHRLPLLIAMHGYGGDKSSMMRLARRINENDFAIAALQGPHQHLVYPTKENPALGFGFGWLTNFHAEESVAVHHSAVEEIIQTAAATERIDTSRVYLLGFSQACGVNFRFAFTHSNLIAGVVAICGGIPGDWETPDKYSGENIDVLYIAGERDEFYTPTRIEGYAAALRTRARSVSLHIMNAGHEVPRDAYSIIDEWIKKKEDLL